MTQKSDQREAVFTSAHNDFEKGLGSYAAFKVSNHALSEDLVQDTFIKTWAYLVKGGEITKMKAFLYHVLNGLIIDEYRKRKVNSLDLLMEYGLDPACDEQEIQKSVFDGKAAIALIAQLPKSYQKIMRMRYIQDLSLTEIATLTGKTKNSTAVQSHRGLEKLKELYFSQKGVSA